MIQLAASAASASTLRSVKNPYKKDAIQNNIFSTRIKDAGVAIRHSRGGIAFYAARPRNGLERVGGKGTH